MALPPRKAPGDAAAQSPALSEEALRGVTAALAAAAARLRAQDPGGAVALLAPHAALAPSHAPLADALAAAYRRDARHGDAVAVAQAVVAAGGRPGPQLLYERGMAELALGRGPDALTTFDALLAVRPDFAAAWFASHAPALDLMGWEDAERRLVMAAGLPGANRKYAAFLAAYDHLRRAATPRTCPPSHGHLCEGVAALMGAWLEDPARCGGEEGGVRLFGVAASLLEYALERARTPGLVLEFGVRRGASLAVLARRAGQEVHGFDSFEGLPEDWVNAPAGVLSTGGDLPEVPANAHLHPGWFEDSLPPFLSAHPGVVRFANIDSDLYSSARTVLWALGDRFTGGSVVVFDEMIGNRSWRQDEFRAFQEYVATYGGRWSVIAVNLACKQVALIRR